MPDLLFEIGTEELPAWYVTQGAAGLEQGVRQALEGARLPFTELRTFATPRRLAVLVEGLAAQSERRSEKRRGPPESAAYGPDGELTKAALGFAQANGATPEQLVVEETERGRYLFVQLELGGEPAAQLLRPLLGELVGRLPAPRKMRWNAVETPFVRPVSWLLALLDDEVIEVEAAGLRAGRTTRGHRFLAGEEIELASAGDYLPALVEAHVLAGEAERREATWQAVCKAAAQEDLQAVHDEELLAEVTNLVEMPFAVLGGFDDQYLELPEEVLSTVMIHHQRFFPVRTADGAFAARFVAVSNNRVPDVAVVREGYEKVLAGRLYDARFFWNADRSKTLSQHAWSLSGIQFHRRLGSMADKVARVDEVARAFAYRLQLSEAERDVLEAALPIYRADLGTEMVFEFPELEGVMAGAYARAEGIGEEVAEALSAGVRPKGPEDAVPDSAVGALLSAADRADKLVGFAAAGVRASGSADPYGLRRDALGLARLMNAHGWQVPPRQLFEAAAAAYAGSDVDAGEEVVAEADRFLWERIHSLLAEEGLSVQLVRAAAADGPPVITAARRAHLLGALAREEEFPALLALYKRAANLAEKADEDAEVEPARFEAPEEQPLWEALPGARRGIEELRGAAREALAPWDLGRGPKGSLPELVEATRHVLLLKEPLDAFLDNVLVMVDDEAVRRNRLALLREVRDALRGLGRLEELEGLQQ